MPTLGRVISVARASLLLRRFDAGSRVSFARGVRFDAPRDARVTFGERVTVGPDFGFGFGRFEDAVPTLSIGARTDLQGGTSINTAVSVTIGEGCIVSWGVNILDTDFHTLVEADGSSKPLASPVRIGDRVWIGVGATVLKGTTIGHDSVVAAGAVVSGEFPPHSLIAGVPGRVVREISGWR